MRRGMRLIAALLAATVLAAGCSDDDDSADAERTSEERSSGSSSTTSSTTTTVGTSLEAAASSTTKAPARGATATTRQASTATTKPPPPTTTTTIPPCGQTSGSAATFDLGGAGPAHVTVTNAHHSSVVVTFPTGARTLGAGASQSLDLDPAGGAVAVTAAPSAEPAKRFTLSIDFVADGTHELTVSTLNAGEACAGRVKLALTNFHT